MKATIYIPDEKADLYERVRTELGGTISATFVRCMERELELKRATMDRIVVEITDRHTERTSKKAFEGRWIVGTERNPEEYHFDQSIDTVSGGAVYAVAMTKQSRIVVISGPVSGDEPLDTFEVYEDVDDFASAHCDSYPKYPLSLISAVKSELGIDSIEELDI